MINLVLVLFDWNPYRKLINLFFHHPHKPYVIAADQSESELKEVVHVIAPAQCLSYGEKTLEEIEPLTKAVSFS